MPTTSLKTEEKKKKKKKNEKQKKKKKHLLTITFQVFKDNNKLKENRKRKVYILDPFILSCNQLLMSFNIFIY